jgi:hypothetical protein
LLETHNEISAAIIIEARKTETLDTVDWVMEVDNILPETDRKGPNSTPRRSAPTDIACSFEVERS